MPKLLGFAAALVLLFASPAYAHTLILECKKTSGDEVVCRTVMSNGEVAPNVELQFFNDEDYDHVMTGRTDADGMFAVQMPIPDFHIVALIDRAHVASLPSTDIW